MSHAATAMAATPAIQTQAGARPLCRSTNQTRISAPASVIATSKSQLHRWPKVIAWWFEIIANTTGSVK